MGATLKAGDVLPAELLELVGQIRVTEDVRIWVEGADGWALDYWAGPEAPVRWCAAGREADPLAGREVLARSQAGRIFAPSGELRWRCLPSPSPPRCRVVFLGEHDWLPGRLAVRDEIERLDLTPAVDSAILWGQKTTASDGDWVELRVPHRFRYPVPDPGVDAGVPVGVRVWTEVWSDRWGEPHFIRLRDMTAYTIPEGR
jgi:hypothetical protein